MPLELNPLGRKAKAYWNSSGTLLTAITPVALETWLGQGDTIVAGDLYDVTLGLTPEYADITTRKNAAGGFTARKPVIREGEVTFDMLWNTNEAGEEFVQKVIDASNDDTIFAMGFLDYAKDDTDFAVGDVFQGLFGNCYLSFEKTEAIRDVQRASVTVVNANDMVWGKFTSTIS